jgi:Flp pilus assembly protein TadG
MESGASAVEFAIVAAILFMLVFGAIQFGLAYYRLQGLQAAAREGARVAAVGGTQSEVATRLRQAQNGFAGSDIQVSMASSTDNGATWSSTFCDDAGGTPCTSTGSPTPCTVVGIGNLIRVTATVPSAGSKYAIAIPLWGSANFTYSQSGIFRCERSG